MGPVALGIDVATPIQAATAAALRGQGVSFVVRYLSHRQYAKTLTAAEVQRLVSAGLAVVSVWETSADRAKYGAPAGAQDGAEARSVAQEAGHPAGTVIYAAVDFDACDGDMDEIVAYLRAFGAACAPYRVGVYGEYAVCRAMDEEGVTDWAWETYAWSHGLLYPRARLYQYRNGVRVCGLEADLDAALQPEFGAWVPAGRAMPATQPWPSWAPLPALGGGTTAGGGGTVPTLKRGDRGPAVEAMQALLAAAGFSPGAIDGAFGPATEQALRAFQQAKGLTADAVCGPQSWHALAVAASGARDEVRRIIVAKVQQALQSV